MRRRFMEFHESVYCSKLPCYIYVTLWLLVKELEREFQRALGYAVQHVQTATFSLKPEQTAAIRSIYKGKDVFVWLPTGFSKSFCYEAISFVLDWKLKRTDSGTRSSLVLIVSPLVALMVDQVCSLRTRGVKAAIISGGGAGGFDEEFIAKDKDFGECSLLFGAPEAFLRSKWRDTMENPCITQRIVVQRTSNKCSSIGAKISVLLMDIFTS